MELENNLREAYVSALEKKRLDLNTTLQDVSCFVRTFREIYISVAYVVYLMVVDVLEINS